MTAYTKQSREPWVMAAFSRPNLLKLQRVVGELGFNPPPSLQTIADGLTEAWQETPAGKPYNLSTAALFNPDVGRDADPAVQQRKLDDLNNEALELIVARVEEERSAEAMYAYYSTVPLGDRLPQRGVAHIPRDVSKWGSARFLPQGPTEADDEAEAQHLYMQTIN